MPLSFSSGAAQHIVRFLQRRSTPVLRASTTASPVSAPRRNNFLIHCAAALPILSLTTPVPEHLHDFTRHRTLLYRFDQRRHTALKQPHRLYATAPSAGSGGSASGSHHHSRDSKNSSSGSAASSGSFNASGYSSSSSGNSGNNNGGGSDFPSNNGNTSSGSNAAGKQSKLHTAKKVKAKKSKSVHRVKRKAGSGKPYTKPVSSAGVAANGSVSGGSSTAGGNTSASNGGGNSNHSAFGQRNSSIRSNSTSRRTPSTRAKAAARRRKSKARSPVGTKPSTPNTSTAAVSSSSAGASASQLSGDAGSTVAPTAKAKNGSPARKKLLSGKGNHGKRGGGGGRTGGSGNTTSSSKASIGGASLSSSSSSSKALTRSKKKQKKIRICVLTSSYDGADSATASFDNYLCTPQHYIKKDRQKYTFADVSMKKIDSYRTVRQLVTSNKYDVFFNLCDGGRDEKRAGVDVVEALEEHNAAFTGTDSRSFEPSKIDMKLMVGSSGVKVPNFVLLDNEESLAKKCRHLKFPVIVKHLSGYASVGINKDNRCDNLDQLKTKVRAFIREYNHALVEEFIRGREGTVLACADPGSPFGVKVFKPLMFSFLQNSDDFAYFDKKWTMECNDQAYKFLPTSDPAYPAIVEMARNAFKYIMNGVGYGRADFRIDEQSGAPYFLEINPNCGMWYSPKDGGDFADVMVEGDSHWNHERFVANAVARALKEQAARKPWYFISHDRNGQFSTRASKTVPEGKCLFGDAIHPIPVVSKALYKLGEEDPTVGCVICRGDGIHHAVALRHSCEPNMHFVHGRTLLFAAKRQINVGEELTVDYATLRDESMPHFVCSCGTQNCRSVIFSMPATARTVEAKAMKRLLREKRQVWLKEKADREAERILKKRSSTTGGGASLLPSGGSSSGSNTSSSNNGGGGGSALSSSSGGNGGG